MLLVTALLMLASVLLTGLMLLPGWRELGFRMLRRARDRAGAAADNGRRVLLAASDHGGQAAIRLGERAGSPWRARRGPWLAAAAFVLFPPLLAFTLLPMVTGPTGAADPQGSRQRDAHIARLLQGERLVPPPPLPPEAFTTREVERVRPELRGADRRWDRLDPDFTQRLLRIFAIMREQHGYELVLLEGYRSPERQQQLADRGAQVTNAGMYRSYHQFGLAADVAFLRDGRVVISERDPWAMRGYTLYGEVAEAHGLTWGGNWRMRDYGHVELRRPGARRRPGDANL